MAQRITALLLLVSISAGTASRAAAQDAPANAPRAAAEDAALDSPPSTDRRGVAPLVQLGWYDGCAGGVQFDAGAIALRASFAYFPVILIVREDGFSAGSDSSLELLHSAQGNADFLWYFAAPGERSRIGLSVGYRYNTLLLHGVGLAFQGDVTLSDSVRLLYTFGLSLHWQGSDRVRDELGLTSDATFNFPFGAGFQGGAGVGLAFPL
jgi:hypothetical protein